LHAGNEQLVGDIRALWNNPLIVNRPGRPRDRIGADGLRVGRSGSLRPTGAGNPDFVARVKTDAPITKRIVPASLAARAWLHRLSALEAPTAA